MAFTVPLPGARSEHQHLPPSLRHPWWSQACPTCSPDFYAAFTADSQHGMADETSEAECPICLTDVKYRKGKFRPHREDDSDCRASGLSLEVAEHLLLALTRGYSAARFIAESRSRGRVPRGDSAIPVSGEIQAALRTMRTDAGVSLQEVADWGGFNVSSIHDWEKQAKQPLLDSAVKWASLFDRRLVLSSEDFKLWVTSATAAAWFLGGERLEEGFTIHEVAKRAGASESSMSSRERGKTSSSMTLTDTARWAQALGYELVLAGEG